MGTSRQGLINIYNETKEITKGLPKPLTRKITFENDIKISHFKPNIQVIDSDSVSALNLYKFNNPCVLNMASSKNPGGGVEKGSSAQEESLFRCSNLYHISKDFYPLKDNEALYSTNVSFVKDKYYSWMRTITCDVITIAAPNLNYGGLPKNYEQTEEYINLIKNKIRLMLSSDTETIILGAWGCGVFKNNPETIANLFKDVISEGTNIKNIIFAVINDNNSVADNYNIFKKILD